jgi:hypothetical protein
MIIKMFGRRFVVESEFVYAAFIELSTAILLKKNQHVIIF